MWPNWWRKQLRYNFNFGVYEHTRSCWVIVYTVGRACWSSHTMEGSDAESTNSNCDESSTICQQGSSPCKKLTYPTLGKGNHLQKRLGRGNVSSQKGTFLANILCRAYMSLVILFGEARRHHSSTFSSWNETDPLQPSQLMVANIECGHTIDLRSCGMQSQQMKVSFDMIFPILETSWSWWWLLLAGGGRSKTYQIAQHVWITFIVNTVLPIVLLQILFFLTPFPLHLKSLPITVLTALQLLFCVLCLSATYHAKRHAQLYKAKVQNRWWWEMVPLEYHPNEYPTSA